MEGAMAKLATPEHEHVKRLNADGVYAVLVVLWIVAVWVVALYVAADAANDTSAGVGGNSFLFLLSQEFFEDSRVVARW
jgi:hypothetical protein